MSVFPSNGRRTCQLPVVLAVAFALAACSGSNKSSTNDGALATTLRVGVSQGLVDADPHTTTLGSDIQILEQVYEGLARLDPKSLKIVPALAASWTTSDDGLVWTFKLRPGVTFHDGRKLSASDVKYSLDRILNPATKAMFFSDLEPIDKVSTPDAQTVTVDLKRPYSILTTLLASPPFTAIVPNGSGGSLSAKPNGTGPYSFTAQVPKTSVSLKAYPEYWAGKAKTKDLLFQVVPDQSALISALVSGQVDFITTVPMEQVKKLQSNDRVQLIRYESAWVDEIGFNTAKKPFRDVRVRQAVALTLDKAAIAKAATFGLGKAADTMVAVSSYEIAVKVPSRDLSRAKALLAEAGYPSGFSFDFAPCGGTAFPQMTRAGEEIASELRAIGLTAKVTSQEPGVWVNSVVNEHSFDATICGLVNGLDPDERSYRYFTSQGSNNFSQYKNAQVDNLLNQGRIEGDPNKRLSLYNQAWQILVDEAPWIALYQYPGLMAASPKVSGFVTTPNSDLIFTGVTVRK